MSNSRDFTGKVVIVTGSTSGIGEGIVTNFSKLGANVVITGLLEADVKRVSKMCELVSPKKLKPLEVVADITIDEQLKSLIDTTINTFSKLDILVNNAGITLMTSIFDNDLMDKYGKLMNLNLRSVVLLTHLAVPYLEQTKGTIINTSSIGSLQPNFPLFIYCMTKSAIDMFTKCLAIELGPKQIRVNSVNPGPVETQLLIAMGMNEEENRIAFEKLKKATLVGRVGRPQDIANTVAFLASSDAQFITGTNLVNDGGAMIKGVNPDFLDK